jgi:hypothetical protein
VILTVGLVAMGLSARAEEKAPLRPQDIDFKVVGSHDAAKRFPDGALRRSVNGDVVVMCTVKTKGPPADCHAVEETPAGLGFAGSAVTLTRQFRFAATAHDGSPSEGRPFRHTVQFRIAERKGGKIDCPTANRSDPNAEQPTIICGWRH